MFMQGLGASVLMLLLKQLARQFDAIAPRYGKHGALRKAAMNLPLGVPYLPVFDVLNIASVQAIKRP